MPAPIDLTGQVFGKLTVLELIPQEPFPNGRPRPRLWLCECDCGNKKDARIDNLRSGITTHCGCNDDLVGQRYGSLVVIEQVYNEQRKERKWKLQCDCGQSRYAVTARLKSNEITHCGCKTKEIVRNNNIEKYKDNYSSRSIVLSRYKYSAKRRDLPFDISEDHACELFASNCYYCGAEPSRKAPERATSKEFIYNGIDRYDNDKGYVEGNVVPCCTECNMLKRDMHGDEFISLCKKISHRYESGLIAYKEPKGSNLYRRCLNEPYYRPKIADGLWTARTLGKNLINVYKQAAKKRDHPYLLSDEHSFELFKEDCAYCGAEPGNEYKYHKIENAIFIYNGIDRLNNDIGYIEGNVVPCCFRCNKMKSNRDFDDLMSHINKLVI